MSDGCATMNDAYDLGFEHAQEAALQKIQRYKVALEIIAGRRQCVDSLMSHVDIAIEALEEDDE